METKICKDCGRELPIDAFAKSACTKDGHEGSCKDCRNKRAKELRHGLREKSKSAKIQKAVKTPKPTFDKLLESLPVTTVDCRGEQAHLAGLVNWTDADLVAELRNRGYKVTATKEITTIVEL